MDNTLNMDSKKKKIDWVGFFMNFLAVVLGIVITFCGEGLISSKQERDAVKSSLLLVCNELQDNKDNIVFIDSALVEYANASTFLIKYEGHYNDAPKDSMARYCNIPFTSYTFAASESALELLKTSSLFTKIKDNNISLDIIRAYAAIRDEFEVIEYIIDKKDKYLEDAMYGEAKAVMANSNVTAVELWTSMVKTIEGRQFLRELYRLQHFHSSEETLASIDSTIQKIYTYIGVEQ